MGVWGSIAKGIVGALPIVGPIIQGGIEAATAKKAADQQVQGGQRAMDIQNKVYAQQQALMQPYYNTGTTAFTTLGGLLGLPQGAPSGAGAPPVASGTGMQPNTPWGGTVTDSMANSGAITDPSKAPDATYGANNQWIGGQTTQQQRAAMPTASSYNSAQTYGSAPTGPPMVKVKAPNGSVYQIPADKVAEAQQNGGTVIGSA